MPRDTSKANLDFREYPLNQRLVTDSLGRETDTQVVEAANARSAKSASVRLLPAAISNALSLFLESMMEFIIDLWLPILLSAIALHFASFTAWVVLPHHFSDKKKLDEEDKFMELIKHMEIRPGNYMFPYANSKKEQGSEEYAERYKQGPRGCLDIYHMPNMGVNLGLTLLFFLVTATVIGYITHVACPPADSETTFMKVFRFAGTVGILTYASSGILNRIWFRARTLTDFIDGVVFGLILGLIFGLLYPISAATS